VALHLHDNDGNSDQHLTPLRGQIRWRDIMQALTEIGYAAAFNLEVPGESRVTPVPARPSKMRYLVEICKYLLEPAFASEKASA
jgi:sugar phosphate isomerase/epimerase